MSSPTACICPQKNKPNPQNTPKELFPANERPVTAAVSQKVCVHRPMKTRPPCFAIYSHVSNPPNESNMTCCHASVVAVSVIALQTVQNFKTHCWLYKICVPARSLVATKAFRLHMTTRTLLTAITCPANPILNYIRGICVYHFTVLLVLICICNTREYEYKQLLAQSSSCAEG